MFFHSIKAYFDNFRKTKTVGEFDFDVELILDDNGEIIGKYEVLNNNNALEE